MLFARPVQYAIHAMLHLASRAPQESLTVRHLAREIEIPEPILAKVIQRLARGRLVRTSKGPHGGVRLAHPPDEVNLLAIVAAMEGAQAFDRCLIGSKACSEIDSCMLHQEWEPLKEQLLTKLSSLTLAQLQSRRARSTARPTLIPSEELSVAKKKRRRR